MKYRRPCGLGMDENRHGKLLPDFMIRLMYTEVVLLDYVAQRWYINFIPIISYGGMIHRVICVVVWSLISVREYFGARCKWPPKAAEAPQRKLDPWRKDAP